MDSDGRIASTDDVPDDTTLLFTVRESDGESAREAILVRTDDGIAAWLNYCQHLTHIHLDKGSGAPMRNGEIVCTNHGAYFESDSGRCTYGPCEGAYLTDVEVDVEGGDVYLTDDDFEFVGLGPSDDRGDLSSTSNVEF